MKHVLITAGPVYGRLDDNKLVSNRVRGIWAVKFAGFLSSKGVKVTLLLADTMPPNSKLDFGDYGGTGPAPTVIRHDGFKQYLNECLYHAPKVDAAVMAAAVVNWLPAEPVEGKMSTEGFKEGERIDIPFLLAPRVIDRMKKANPKLTLIGCKMLSGATEEQLIETAYEKVLIAARCNVVIANDMQLGLKKKWLVYPDGSRFLFDNLFEALFKALSEVIYDEHYRTERWPNAAVEPDPQTLRRFNAIVNAHRGRFTPRPGSDRVFGSIAVRDPAGFWLCSPREKGGMFSSNDAVVVWATESYVKPDGTPVNVVYTVGGEKATLNAPLLIRAAYNRPGTTAVLHLHEEMPGAPKMGYAPPGTMRDNNRELPDTPAFNIEGHGFIQCITHGVQVTPC